MAGNRRVDRRNGGEASPVRLIAVAVILIGLVLVSLRLLPGLAVRVVRRGEWGDAGSGTSDRPTGAGTDRSARQPSSPSPNPSPSLEPLPFVAKDLDLDIEGWYSWSVLDRRTGKIIGSKNMGETSTTASMIKAWIVADYLRRAADAGQTPSDAKLADATRIIRDSDNTRAEQFYNQVGRDASIKRLISMCKLTDSSVAPDGGWSRTRSPPGTPPGWATASSRHGPPGRSGPSGCSTR